ncbi:MAG: prepilin-type N-terminal cleavage/methylation domain-containing protein [Verrucomicrobiota bacterium]|nr:prepilin-type N-terminal cleavage/methylation domain-containing protein [Verrucomicrobiota bacterium]
MRRRQAAFTLIELLVVIGIIAVLIGFLFPVVQSSLDRTKKVQAKNDLTQIVTAVNAFYTEYGKYPSSYAPEMTYDGKNGNTNDQLFNILRGIETVVNTRQIPFISPPIAKIAWGTVYLIRLDTDYNDIISNPYSANAGFSDINGA